MRETAGGRLSDVDRRLANMLAYGTVEAVDYNRARAQVRTGENVTAWIPWGTGRAGPDRTWCAPEIGEQVLLAAPNGDLNQGCILTTVYQSRHPAPANRETLTRTVYDDGTVIEYDRKRGRLLIESVNHVEIRARTITIHASERLWVDCFGVGYRLLRQGAMVLQRIWRPDLTDSLAKSPPEIDGDRKTGRRTD